VGFLAPWFLGGLFLLGLPIYIHLLRQHTSTPRPFSSLMFFERRTQSSIKHRRLRYLLLMALRLALLALLILAFANPFVTRDTPAASGDRLVTVAIDDSFSMRAGDRLEQARREALSVVAGMRAGERGVVMAPGSQVRFLTQQTDDAAELRAAVSAIRAGDARSSYGGMARALRAMGPTARGPIEVHLFSDMQKTSLPEGFADLQMPPGSRLILHPAGRREEANWTVESVHAPASVADPKKARVQATVAGFGAPAAERTVSLAVNNKVVATKTVAVPREGRASVEFVTLDVPYGFSRCEVRIDSADRLKEDDRFLFAVERSDPRRVLFVHEAREARAVLYFRTALAAAAESAFALEAVSAEQAGGIDPSRFAFVVLSDVLSVPASFEEALRKYVRGGGSLLIAAGPASGRRPRVPVLDAAVLESRYFARSGVRFQTPGWVDPAHPSIRRAGRWEGVKFYQVVRTEPGAARVLARLTDQTPLLLEKQMGEGRVLLFASTFDNLANDFPLHPVFVPFIEQTARYLSGLVDRVALLEVDGFLELRSNKERGISVEVIEPDGRRPFSLNESATVNTYQATREGFYEVRRANGRHEVVAVNADRRESDLTPASEEVLSLWRKTGEGAAAATGSGEARRRPLSLWWYVMLVVLAAAVAESLLASRYLRPREEAT